MSHTTIYPPVSSTPLDIDAELARFEAEERQRLGLPANDTLDHWTDPQPQEFTREQRDQTTILVCGLTMAHDLFIQHALRGIGYNVVAMDVPDNAALQFGREFGNRGQCNPTYFTVGNLIKHLSELEESGLMKKEIAEKYLFLTAGACGPCRFGTYVTEYRKALRDAGFDGFRVMLFQQTGGVKQATGGELGLEMNPAFFWALVKSIMIGDVLNAVAYRIRPYEVEAGSTDAAVSACKELISDALEKKAPLVPTLVRCRRRLAAVAVDRTRIKPRVAIIGEFWAMTTEGDGNYGLQRFLESEGAEVDIQLVTAWILYMIWQAQFDTENRAKLRGTDSGSKFSLDGVDVRKRMISLAAADKLIRSLFQTFAQALGLKDYHLPDMHDLARVSDAFYDNNLRGGEGHMEVGKLIQNIAKNKVSMTLSVKPFGCMPSSSVSDGVQSLITEMYPEGIFLPIETTGDGAVNVYSRVQMQLFKAKQLAQKEVQRALDDTGMTMDEVQHFVSAHPRYAHAFHRSPHAGGCTTTDLVQEIAAHRRPVDRLRESLLAPLRRRARAAQQSTRLIEVARTAAARARETRSSTSEAMSATARTSIAGDPRDTPPASERAHTRLPVLN